MDHAIYTCPMHPEVRQRGPGSCPKCGMALEALAPTAEPEDNAELRDMTRRLIVAAVLSAPLLVLAMSEMIPAVGSLMSMRTRTFVELALATPVCLWAAWPFFVRAAQSIAHRSLNMFTLIGLGVALAFG